MTTKQDTVNVTPSTAGALFALAAPIVNIAREVAHGTRAELLSAVIGGQRCAELRRAVEAFDAAGVSILESLGHNSTEAGAPAGSPHLNVSTPEQLPGSAATAERADHSGRATVTHMSHIADEGLASVLRRFGGVPLFPLFPSEDVAAFLREELRRAAERGYALGWAEARHAAPSVTKELEATKEALRRAVGVVNDVERHAPAMRAVLDDFASWGQR